ncbi:ATP-binding protein [Actinokineospora iranica]|uniref:Predicted ATPase n=1 Tax=Actinokineospora iranica TaxID=1271860 RepID=A0A1G6T0F6_9PSEU|nr:LuxR C-terminal-related transcriptional regulator [Actinokineospora iranica]SDD22670.1 Predicted ATPase [Actinokineospora iranica]
MLGSATAAKSRGELTSYVGRQREGAQVRRLLNEARLITLTGPGGVGKTRLAARVATEVSEQFQDGVVFVGLAEVRDPALLVDMMADRLGLLDQSSKLVSRIVIDHLRTRRLLLVLDNCEHLVDACAEFARVVLAECPDVVLLATSRQSLGVVGEQVLAVPPLAVPDEATPPEDLARFDSVRLFLDRAAGVSRTFQASPENSADLVRLCRQLEGLPLAIELAAVRTRSLSPRQIAERLTRRLALLTSGAARTAPRRQQTLRATVDWSHDLCSPAEQAVWARASVFAGSFDLDAGEHVCGGVGEVLDLIDGLLDKSVLIREEPDGRDDVVRYRMLETLREYGHEKLVESGDADRVARLHRDWFDRLTATADAQWAGPDQIAWAVRLRQDHANLRAALGWSVAEPGEAEVALRMASRLDEYWTLRGSNTEARMWLNRALAATPPDHPDRAFALTRAAGYAFWQFDVDAAGACLAEADTLGAGDETVTAHITHVRGLGALLCGEFAEAAKLSAETTAFFRARGDHRRELHPLFLLAMSTAVTGDLETARRVVERAVALTESTGNAYYHSMSLYGRQCVEVLYGDLDVSIAAGRAGLRACLLIGNRFGRAHHIESLAWAACRQGDHSRAATLFGAAAALWETVGSSPEHPVSLSVPHFWHLESTREALGAARFDDRHAAGRAMSDEDATRYALSERACAAPTTPDGRRGPLTARETEIAELVAAGLTNQEIADRLVIARRTAETHVANILTKLGVHNRSQIAAWVMGRDGEPPR